MSVFPEQLDTDLEIPRVDDEVTEINGDSINALRDAVFNIQKALGISPQGNKTSLAERIGVSVDSNGNIKASALESIGLATLPIINSHISPVAAISESKLDLDFSTQSLKNSVNSLTTDVSSLQTSLNSLNSSFIGHTSGTSNRHDGYDVDSGAIAGLSATTVGDALNEFSTILITGDIRPPHIDFSLPNTIKHTANYISVDASSFTTIDQSSVTVQDALDDIDGDILGQQVEHMDNFHSNGILKEINSGDSYNPNQRKIGPTSISYTAGTTVVKIAGITSFSNLGINKGDILQINSNVDDAGTFRISATGPRSGTGTLGGLPELDADEIDVFHVFTSTETSATGTVYKAASVSSESAPLACSVRNSETLVDTVTILNPDAARVVSIGFNGTILGTDGYEISLEVGVGNSMVRGLTIPNLHLERLGSSPPDVVTAQSVAERINAYVSHPNYGYHFPISAFRVGNEIAIAHNMVGSEFTLRVLDGYTGNRPLGFDEYGADILDLDIVGNENNLFNINGVSRSSLRTLVDGYASISSSTDTFAIYNSDGSLVNPTNIGIRSGAVLHITEHPTLDTNGSYTLYAASSTNVSVFSVEPIPAPANPTTFSVRITDSHISLNQLFSAETDLGLVEIFVDEDGRSLVNQRLTYDSLGPNPEFSIISVTDGFAPSTITIVQGTVSGTNLRTFHIVADSVSGNTVTVDKDFIGTFKLYHTDNINYLTIRVNKEIVTVGSTSVTIDDTLNLDETMRLSVLHFDSDDSITNLTDTRYFGNIGSEQIRDDFTELFSQRPVSDLRSNGVVRGFDVMSIPYIDSLTGMQALPLNGGTAYVNGVRVTVETQKVPIQSFDVNRDLLSSVDVIIGINDFGTIRAFGDSLSEILTDGYTSSTEFGKVLPLYRVTLDGDGLIDQITDIRLFVNNLDEKIDLIVDESNNVVGSFRSLAGVLLYAENYPGSEKLTVRIINEVSVDRAIVVPDGVSIIGGAPYGGGKHRIVNTLDLNDHVLTLSGNNRLENIEIDSDNINQDGYLVSVNGSNVNIEKCSLKFSDTVGLGSFTNGSDHAVGFESNATTNVRVVNNRIDNVFAGIVSTIGCDNLVITDNTITNIVGFGIETHGIFVGGSRVLSNIEISRNTIEVPSIAFSDIMGIKVTPSSTMNVVRINNNTVRHTGGDTMTSGIHVESVGSGVVTNLFVTNNTVNGIQLDANNIFGIYVDGVTRANVSNNILSNIGSTAGSSTAFIKIGDSVSLSQIYANILETGDCLSGIDVGASTNTSIIGNTINDVGDESTGNFSTSTVFIRGNSPGAKINNNTLVASSSENSPFGIHWSAAGSQTQISNNILKANSAGLDSFTDYGIRFLATDMDIIGNTITGMTSASDPVAIGSSSSAVRAKIIGNTVYGTLTAAINLSTATDCFVANNMLPSTDTSVIASSNLIGINRGLLDSTAITPVGTSTFDISANEPHWIGDYTTGSVKENIATTFPRSFSVDISKIPNGAKIVSVEFMLNRPSGSPSTVDAIVRKISTTAPFTATDIQSSTLTSTGTFVETIDLSASPETVDYSSYSYSAVLEGSTDDPGAGDETELYTIRINFRY